MTAIQLIESKLLEGRKNPAILGGVGAGTKFAKQTSQFQWMAGHFDASMAGGRDTQYIKFGPMHKSSRKNILRRYILPKLLMTASMVKRLGSPIQYRILYSEYDRHMLNWAKDIHNNVVRRAVKAGFLNKDLSNGVNFDRYSTTGFDLKGHDSSGHSVLGALPTLVGEIATEHMDRLVSRERDYPHDTAGVSRSAEKMNMINRTARDLAKNIAYRSSQVEHSWLRSLPKDVIGYEDMLKLSKRY